MSDFRKNLEHTSVAFASAGRAARVFNDGDIIGENYRLKGLIGRGGMGYVFAAEHLMLHRDFALKVLDPSQVNEISWNRFQMEGKAIARLDHPNIVKIYNMGVDRGDCPYYVMDLLNGVALLDCIKDAVPLSLDEIVDMYIQLAEGFGYAHNRGIIHRDVKPGNIVLIDGGGQYPTAKIVDFGIAKLTGTSSQAEQSLTAAGEICGSPFYMSPEQGLGGEIDSRSDIYSLGCTLFETLCRRPPFMGKTALETLMLHQNEPAPQLADFTNEIWPHELESIVAKMLAKRLSERYQSMSQLKHDLERVRANKAVGKNVETGFRSSAETRLEDLGSRYENEKYQWVKDKRILRVVLLAVSVLAGSVFFHFFKGAASPGARVPRVTFDSGNAKIGLTAEPGAGSAIKNEQTRIAEKFGAVKAITSTIDKGTGLKTFHGIPEPIGSFTWYQGAKDICGLDATCTDDSHVEVCEGVQVPASVPLIFELAVRLYRDTWVDPKILAKFAPNELIGLNLDSTIPTAFGSDEELKGAGESVEAVLDAIAGWSNLQVLELYNVPVTKKALLLVGRHKTLRHLTIRDGSIDCEALGKLANLPLLNYIRLSDLPDCDPAIKGFEGSPSISLIDLRDSRVSASGLRSLSRCHNLKRLIIDGCPIGASELDAIAKIKSLKSLSMTRVVFRPHEIEALSRLNFIDKVDLNLNDWTAEDKRELIRRLPNVLKRPSYKN